MFSGDGSVKKDRAGLSYCTTSKRLAEQIVLLLTRFGILSSLHHREDNRKETYKDVYFIDILGNDAKTFANEIGLLGRKQNELLNVLSKHPNLDDKRRFPKQYNNELKEILKENKLTPHFIQQLDIYTEEEGRNFWYKESNTISFSTLFKILSQRDIPKLRVLVERYYSNDFILTPIRDIVDSR